MNHFGYYGKTIHRGDFVRYNLPQAFISVWDDWLLQLMIKGEEEHAERWSGIYQNSPTYRFALSPSIAGEDAWLGVVFPSTDKVGRRFPFCIACALPADIAPISGDQSGDGFIESWYVEVERFCREIQNPSFNFDSLQQQMAEFQKDFQSRRELTQYTTFTPGPSDGKSQLAIVGNLSTLTHTRTGIVNLLHAALKQASFHYSQWISINAPDPGETILVEGLPTGKLGLALFDHQWVEGGAGIINAAVLMEQQQSAGGPTDTYIPSSDLAGLGDSETTADSANEFANEAVTDIADETAVNDATIPMTALHSEDLRENDPDSLAEQPDSFAPVQNETDEINDRGSEEIAVDHFSEPEEFSVNPKVEKLEIEEDTSSDDPWN